VVEPSDNRTGFSKRGKPLPDLTNLVKGTEDALAGIVVGNDVQTCRIETERRYGDYDCVVVAVYALDSQAGGSLGLVA
jgi:Holliday junction resolvase RusA-like endonuclease